MVDRQSQPTARTKTTHSLRAARPRTHAAAPAPSHHAEPTATLAALATIAFAACGSSDATIHATVGLGIGLVAGPALIAVDPAFLPDPPIMATLLLTVRHVIVDGHHADRGTVGRAALGVPVGLAVGLAVVALADDRTMRIVIGAAIVIAAVALLLGLHATRTSRTDVTGGRVFALGMITAGIPDPAAAVEKLYGQMDRPFLPEHADAIRRYIAHKPKGKFGKHKYSPEEWGFDPVALREKMRPYTDQYGIALES